jgi:proline racemase
MAAPLRIPVVDSHTAGEPTRVVVAGGPALGNGSMARCRERFAAEHDRFRSLVVNEPRGSDVLVGALLLPPCDPGCAFGVLFFNNVGVLQMCGHGLIGVVATLAHQGVIRPGVHRFDTPVGPVAATLAENGEVSFDNVPSHRAVKDAEFDVPGIGTVTGDIAWGGNWFFLAKWSESPLCLSHVDRLTDVAWRIRGAVNSQGHPEVDHVELTSDGLNGGAEAGVKRGRNFVLCPGKAYDRSPCGTGTSAKLACLAADGLLAPGEDWIQESVLGTEFRGSYRWADAPSPGGPASPSESRSVVPTVRGRAFVTGENLLLLNPDDPFAWGIRADSAGH